MDTQFLLAISLYLKNSGISGARLGRNLAVLQAASQSADIKPLIWLYAISLQEQEELRRKNAQLLKDIENQKTIHESEVKRLFQLLEQSQDELDRLQEAQNDSGVEQAEQGSSTPEDSLTCSAGEDH